MTVQPEPAGAFAERALAFGRDVYSGHGKIEILPKVGAASLDDMAVAYTPGVGHVVRRLLESPEEIWRQTAKANLVALVTDGSAVMGFGNIGPHAGLPVMEGKAVMFKALAGIDCMPLCLRSRDADHFCDLVESLEPSFGGINIEDVAAPDCFAILARLEEQLPIPAIHDDQFGTATVVTAALLNALKVTGRPVEQIRVVINGLGAAGTAALDMVQALGAGDVIAVDRPGILARGVSYPGRPHWTEIAQRSNAENLKGDLALALQGADVFIGLSTAGLVTPDMVRTMAGDPIVFALANPEPEIMPDLARGAGAAVVASGRFDYPNHCNNVLAFPGLMRGALDSRAKKVSMNMRLAAARQLASYRPEADLGPDAILPSPLDLRVHAAVAEATAMAAVEEGLARIDVPPGQVHERTLALTSLVAQRQLQMPRFHPESAKV